MRCKCGNGVALLRFLLAPAVGSKTYGTATALTMAAERVMRSTNAVLHAQQLRQRVALPQLVLAPAVGSKTCGTTV
jgi:hypothetical protein